MCNCTYSCFTDIALYIGRSEYLKIYLLCAMLTVIKKGMSASEIKVKLDSAIAKAPGKDIMKYAGKLKLSMDPHGYQSQLRNEWKERSHLIMATNQSTKN